MFSQFLLGLCVLIVEFRESFIYKYIDPLWDLCFANIFPQSVAYHLIYSLSLWVEVFNFDKVFFINFFSFMSSTFSELRSFLPCTNLYLRSTLFGPPAFSSPVLCYNLSHFNIPRFSVPSPHRLSTRLCLASSSLLCGLEIPFPQGNTSGTIKWITWFTFYLPEITVFYCFMSSILKTIVPYNFVICYCYFKSGVKGWIWSPLTRSRSSSLTLLFLDIFNQDIVGM